MSQLNTEKKTLDMMFIELEQTNNDVASKRDAIINKVETAILEMELDFNGANPEFTEAQIKAITTYSSLLKDKSDNTQKRIQTYMRDKEGTTNDKLVAEMAVALLNRITHTTTNEFNANKPPVDLDEEKNKLDQALSESGTTILKTELKSNSQDFDEE